MSSEKEYNGILFDQLEILERLEEVAKSGDIQDVLSTIEKEKRYIMRKLYQEPPLAERDE